MKEETEINSPPIPHDWQTRVEAMQRRYEAYKRSLETPKEVAVTLPGLNESVRIRTLDDQEVATQEEILRILGPVDNLASRQFRQLSLPELTIRRDKMDLQKNTIEHQTLIEHLLDSFEYVRLVGGQALILLQQELEDRLKKKKEGSSSSVIEVIVGDLKDPTKLSRYRLVSIKYDTAKNILALEVLENTVWDQGDGDWIDWQSQGIKSGEGITADQFRDGLIERKRNIIYRRKPFTTGRAIVPGITTILQRKVPTASLWVVCPDAQKVHQFQAQLDDEFFRKIYEQREA